MNQRRWNWPLWTGFVLSLVALPSYFLFFAKFPITRDVPWANFLMFAIGGALLVEGLRRAYRMPGEYRGKIAGPILAVLSFAVLAFFSAVVFFITRQLPPSSRAPHVGASAASFELPDTHGRLVTLTSLLTTPLNPSSGPPKGVLLIFYRGYW